MVSYIRSILGAYTPLAGDGIASINIEYVIGAILLIMSIHFILKMFLSIFYRFKK